MVVSTNSHKKVILFNGPPGVGKDTAVRTALSYLTTHAPWHHARHIKFAEPLKKATHALYGVHHWDWQFFDKKENAKFKDTPCGEFFGKSPRQAYISMSEDYAKTIDPDFFGYVAVRTMAGATTSSCFLFSDSGFLSELEPVIEFVGAENVMIVELYSDQHTFEDDSRGYIGKAAKDKYPKITVKKINNEFGDTQDEELFKVYCKGAVKGFLNIEERER